MTELPMSPNPEQVRICKGIDDVPNMMMPRKM